MITTGFIGLGIMGNGMVRKIITDSIGDSKDHKLIVWNRSVEKSEALKQEYPELITIADSAKDVVAQSRVTFSMLSTPEASSAVFPSVLEGVSDSTVLVDCATLQVEDMEKMNSAVTKAGGKFLEAPVSGSKVPAANGSLIFLCGSDGKAAFDDEWVVSCLSSMGKASHFLGPVGQGTRAKLVVNGVMGTMLAAYSEGIHLAQECGLDGATMVEVRHER